MGVIIMYIQLFLSALIGYLFGSLNSSLIVGRFYGVDVRKHGSGNAGTSNALRTLGKKAALLVLIGDIVKGILAYIAGYYIFGGQLGGMLGGTAAILGHVWPIFFGFKGGKGVLTSFAVLMFIDWRIALGLLGVFIIIVFITRFISLGSMIAAALFPVTSIILEKDIGTIVFSGIIAVLIIVKHHANIKRLLGGTEAKLSFKAKKSIL